MIIEKYHEKIRYTLTNDNLKEGDEVFPIGSGRVTDDEEFILSELIYEDYMTGFPDEPHKILDLKHSDYKPYEVRTDHGYSPVERYYKIIKKEEKIVEWKDTGLFKVKTRNEWVEIK